MKNTSFARATAGLIAIVLTGPAIVLSGPTIAGAHALSGAAVRSSLAAQKNGSTFTEASVTRSASAPYVIRWRSGAKRVTVSATTDRTGAGGTPGRGRAEPMASSRSRVWPPLRAGISLSKRILAQRLSLAERALELPHAPANARDLGGHRTSDGKWVRPGLLFRSNRLSSLDDNEVSYLEQLGVAHVVDFRSPIEIASKPDRVPDGRGVLGLQRCGRQ